MTKEYKSSLLAELNWRGFIYQQTHEELDEALATEKLTLYCGFDPSAPSMHVGNLLAVMALAHFKRHGHNPMALVGGATGMIGDPSGRDEERDLLSEEKVQANVASIQAQMNKVLGQALSMHRDQGSEEIQIPVINNADWFSDWTFIDFLRDVGRYFRVNQMLQKDSVRTRLEEREQGISFTEFSYMLIQAYDFLYLFEERGCRLQIGGSDQWGNITSGTELIRRKTGATCFGLSIPLITSAEGTKLGKSLKGAVYLDPEMTSPYEFYQYWINQDDRDCGKLLRLFTFLPLSEIEELERVIEDGENRGQVQQRLAMEVTTLIHGKEQAEQVLRASRMLFGEKIEGLTDRDLRSIFADVPSTEVKRSRLDSGELSFVDILAETGLQRSKGAARRLIQQGGAYINNVSVDDVGRILSGEDLASQSMMVLRSGRKNYHVLQFVE